MIRLLLVAIGWAALVGIGIFYLDRAINLDTGNVIALVGYALGVPGLVILYFQVKNGVNQTVRGASLDFMMGPVSSELVPLLKELRALLGRPLGGFKNYEHLRSFLAESTMDEQKLLVPIKDILNFYERMAIGIRSGVLDSQMLYDDQGFQFLEFTHFCRPHIDELRRKYHERIYANVLALAAEWQKRYAKQTPNAPQRPWRAFVGVPIRRKGPLG